MGQLYLVEHTAWDKQTDQPGENAAEQAREVIERLANVVGGNALVLASRTARTMWLGRLLVTDTEVPVHASVHLDIGGNHPSGIASLKDFMRTAIIAIGEDPDTERDVIAITHAPLIEVATGSRPDYGAVIPYDPAQWRNPEYHEVFARHLERQIAAATPGV